MTTFDRNNTELKVLLRLTQCKWVEDFPDTLYRLVDKYMRQPVW
jgi:hypothetical protein